MKEGTFKVHGKYVYQGKVIGKVTDLDPEEWFGKVELSSMPEFAEYGYLDPDAKVITENAIIYEAPKKPKFPHGDAE